MLEGHRDRRQQKISEKMFYGVATNFYSWKKIGKIFQICKTDLSKEIQLKSLIIYRKGWKLSSTTPLIHLFWQRFP